MSRLQKYSCLIIIGLAALHWSACEEQPTDAKINYPYEPAQWYGVPAWSPTNEWIAYNYSGPEGPSSWGIWFIRPDGSENHFEMSGREPDFSPEGRLLTFHGDRRIFAYDLKTKERVQLTFNEESVHPRWSPDGKQIAYSGYPKGGILNLQIGNADGQFKVEIISHNQRVSWAIPDWLPNFNIIDSRGTTRNREATVDLFVIDTTGTLLRQLTGSGISNNKAKVSPDGSKIVWQRWDKETQEIAIWMMNVDGSAQQPLTAGWEPDWAPDGRHIIYRKEGEFIPGQPWDDDDPKVHGSLWIMNVETRLARQFLPQP